MTANPTRPTLSRRTPPRPATLLLAVATVLLAGTPALAQQADLYVATNGNDQWSGRLAQPNADASDGPLATVARSQQVVRRLRSEDTDRQTPVVVMIRE